MNRHIHLQIAFYLLVGALVIAAFSSWFTYQRTYQKELDTARNAGLELLATVSDTAVVASYLGQEDMMSDVVNGLVKNVIISQARMRTAEGVVVKAGESSSETGDYTINYDLASPFTKGSIVGQIVLVQNRQLVEQRANAAAVSNVMSLVVQSVVSAFFAMLLVYFLLAKPIVNMAYGLHSIRPGGPERLGVPPHGAENEIGTLAADINQLLAETENTLTTERSLRQRLEYLEERYRNIFERANAAIFLLNGDGLVTTGNPSFNRLAEDSNRQDSVMDDISQLFLNAEKVQHMMDVALNKKEAISADLQVFRADNQEFWVHLVFMAADTDGERGEVTVEGMMYDITQRRLQENLTRKKAERDHLTGLFNRRGAQTQLEEMLYHQDGVGGGVTIFLLDLDGFKAVNDTYGHDAGDLLLVEVSARLRKVSRTSDTVARWGGDEFVIIMYETIDKSTCFNIGNKMLQELGRPIDIGYNQQAYVGASIGVNSMRQGEFDSELLIKNADNAMYRVKKRGKNGVCFYQQDCDDYSIYFPEGRAAHG
ncbi:MAG: hypothetical protein CR978_00560 [Gammaproteobacteria bacterium]|nr:MAG: hypothetical protein CR978_00560 [Gammaproteobacteria bacterium]PIE39341.1 MAG: hypothetical protein CSA53_02010 [Gammaproteobacteria bacterium]